MKKTGVRMVAAAVAWVGISSMPARAKDICVMDDFGSTFVFRSVKALGPGRAIPLSGIWLAGSSLAGSGAYTAGEAAPVDGTAVMACSGKVQIGVLVHSAKAPARGNNVTASLEGDISFNASGGFDADGDFKLDGGPYHWTAVPCSSVTICRTSECGDGVVQSPQETCDPPGSVLPNGSVCRADCTYCGDSKVQAGDGEQCDQPNGGSCIGDVSRYCRSDCACVVP